MKQISLIITDKSFQSIIAEAKAKHTTGAKLVKQLIIEHQKDQTKQVEDAAKKLRQMISEIKILPQTKRLKGE